MVHHAVVRTFELKLPFNQKTAFIFCLNPILSRQKEAGGCNQSGALLIPAQVGQGLAIPCEKLTAQSINNTFALRQRLHIHRIKCLAVRSWLYWKTGINFQGVWHQSGESKLKKKHRNCKFKLYYKYLVVVATNKLYELYIWIPGLLWERKIRKLHKHLSSTSSSQLYGLTWGIQHDITSHTQRCCLSQALPIRPPLKLDTVSVAVLLASLWSYYKPTATVQHT